MYGFLFPSCKGEEGGNWLSFTLSSQAPLIVKIPETTLSSSDRQTKNILNFCIFKSDLGNKYKPELRTTGMIRQERDLHGQKFSRPE